MQTSLDELKQYLAQHAEQGGLCIAFSAGVDSSLLLKAACMVSDRVLAVTFETALHPKADTQLAKDLAAQWGAEHLVLSVDEFGDERILQNPPDRCYWCKRLLFTELKEVAHERGFAYIVDGTNEDDLHTYRPGLRAVSELSVLSPLAALHITKEQVRALSREIGLEVAERPSAPCLATRLPYGDTITRKALATVEAGETLLKQLGFAVVRLRLHQNIARLELPKEDFTRFLPHAQALTALMHAHGVDYVTLDFEGFRSGSMDLHVE